MKKLLLLLLCVSLMFSSCFQKSKYERCLERYIDNKGYSYQEACDECEFVKELERGLWQTIPMCLYGINYFFKFVLVDWLAVQKAEQFLILKLDVIM